jgi:hypothetical protein
MCIFSGVAHLYICSFWYASSIRYSIGLLLGWAVIKLTVVHYSIFNPFGGCIIVAYNFQGEFLPKQCAWAEGLAANTS